MNSSTSLYIYTHISKAISFAFQYKLKRGALPQNTVRTWTCGQHFLGFATLRLLVAVSSSMGCVWPRRIHESARQIAPLLPARPLIVHIHFDKMCKFLLEAGGVVEYPDPSLRQHDGDAWYILLLHVGGTSWMHKCCHWWLLLLLLEDEFAGHSLPFTAT